MERAPRKGTETRVLFVKRTVHERSTCQVSKIVLEYIVIPSSIPFPISQFPKLTSELIRAADIKPMRSPRPMRPDAGGLDVLDGLVARLLVERRAGRALVVDDALAVLLVGEVTANPVDVSGRDDW